MAKIFCVTNGLSGLLYSSLELARRLRAAAHDVTYLSFPQVRETVINHGITFLPLEPSRYHVFLKADASSGTPTRLRQLRARRQKARNALAVDGFVHQVRASDPDLILIDGEMHDHIIAASGIGVRIAILNTFVSIWRVPGLPPPHHLARPGVGWKGTRAGASLLWHALWLRKQYRALTHGIRRLGCDRIALLRLLARESNFDLRMETDDRHWLIPFTYTRLPVLSLHALEFEFAHVPPPNVHYVGPMLLEPRVDGRITDEVRAELDVIFSQRRMAAGNRKLIYAGFGSCFSTDISLLHRLIGVVEQCTDWELVISLGGGDVQHGLGRLTERVHAFPWLPQMEVLRHADVAVVHGGINTIDECVACCVPMLVYCDFKTDMAGNTARVVHHEIGIAGDRPRDSIPTIRERINQLMYEPRFMNNLKRLRSRYEAYAKKRVAEQVVESLLRQ